VGGRSAAGRVTPKTPFPTPPKVSPVVAQAVETLRVALRKMREANAYATEMRRGGRPESVERAEARASEARTAVTEARCDLDTALED